ncbi:HAD family hydrolase [Natronoglycomyces albus]|uniref:HAD family hydrolase n=1 Tax=Natronoglycomyces albus TaxID=2811108 RepID=A0A895XX12_9ACTN|nr:HAD family hydrolase [Natronoglycomyces albus]QSB06760.1 HAD family hydrolase [Natronoglycomyces albus]
MHEGSSHSGHQFDKPGIGAVLFDFHGTLAQVESLTKSVTLAAERCGRTLSHLEATALAESVGAQGWVGTGIAPRVRPHFAAAWADRDLSEEAHREAFTALIDQAHGTFDGFAEALYDRLLTPDGWVAFADTIPTLMGLKAQGFPIALVSNIGFDARPIIKHLGFDHLIDAWILSYEVGYCKPDARIFYEACLALMVEPRRSLMVGDTLADAGANELGCRTYLLPHAGPGETLGLDAVIKLASSCP